MKKLPGCFWSLFFFFSFPLELMHQLADSKQSHSTEPKGGFCFPTPPPPPLFQVRGQWAPSTVALLGTVCLPPAQRCPAQAAGLLRQSWRALEDDFGWLMHTYQCFSNKANETSQREKHQGSGDPWIAARLCNQTLVHKTKPMFAPNSCQLGCPKWCFPHANPHGWAVFHPTMAEKGTAPMTGHCPTWWAETPLSNIYGNVCAVLEIPGLWPWSPFASVKYVLKNTFWNLIYSQQFLRPAGSPPRWLSPATWSALPPPCTIGLNIRSLAISCSPIPSPLHVPSSHLQCLRSSWTCKNWGKIIIRK